jgi:hypothetical protein
VTIPQLPVVEVQEAAEVEAEEVAVGVMVMAPQPCDPLLG